MKNILLGAAIYSISFGLVPSLSTAAINTSNPEAVKRISEPLIENQKKLQKLTTQINEMKEFHGSLDETDNLFKFQTQIDNLPSDFNSFEQLLNGNNSDPTEWNKKHLYQKPLGGAGSKEAIDAFYNQEVEKAKKRIQGQAAIAEDTYKEIIATKENIDKLLEQLNNAKTDEEIQGFKIQLAYLQTLLQMQTLQMQAAAMMQKAQEKAAEIRKEEELKTRYKDYAKQIRSRQSY
ncbi:type IV secretion system protein [Bartonella sp. A05]|uniref:type IV secretion system protein n=1 Tax=Bartonella sp. A05 TaxID=2967261 RepID=UPI0022A9393F|nr:type IV secretion system protein [Bartonella sp. A05]MCZ2204483.1 type IV secretion system protein [Bartonella sp. A05]